jgi:hypothetical protein
VQGNLHAGFGSEAVGKGPDHRHLANGLPIPLDGQRSRQFLADLASDFEQQGDVWYDTGRLAQEQL